MFLDRYPFCYPTRSSGLPWRRRLVGLDNRQDPRIVSRIRLRASRLRLPIRFLGVLLFGLSAFTVATAQLPTRTPVIGYLAQRSGPTGFDEAFAKGLRDLGYVDGKNVKIEYRWSPKAEELPALAAELVRLGVNVMVSSGYPANKAAKDATSTIPIVIATSGDPVQEGLVASLPRPGGNITGFSVLNRELAGKRLSIVRESVPGIKRVAALFNGSNPAMPPQFKETQVAAERLGLQALPLDVVFPQGIEAAYAEAARAGAGAVIVLSDSATVAHRSELAAAAMKYRLPTMFANRAYLQAGGLISYGPNLADNFRSAAGYVDRILKGANPATMPIEQPTMFELVINLRAANGLGMTLPPPLLLRADDVMR